MALFVEDDEDFDFDEISSAFIRKEDLEGRLLLIKSYEVGERPGADGKPYEYVICDVHVLDGDTTEMITEIPTVLMDFQLSGKQLVIQLKKSIRTGRFGLGRLVRKPSEKKGWNDSWILESPDEGDKTLAVKYGAYMKRKRREEDERSSAKSIDPYA